MNVETEERLAKAAEDYIKFQKRDRRLSRWVKVLFLVFLMVVIGRSVFFISSHETIGNIGGFDGEALSEEHVGIVDFNGDIQSGSDNVVSAERMIPLMREVMENDHSIGMIMRMNSGGGSPVQSEMIFNAIRELREEFPEKPIVAVVEEICASGCYFIAAASDKIFASKSSVVGSIGVRFDSFGLQKLMEKIGVEPRSIHSGENKLLFDPFQDMNEEARRHIQEQMLDVIYQVFIDAVKLGRGERLVETNDLFSGLVWLGEESLSYGLIDGIGMVTDAARMEFNTTNTHTYYPGGGFLDELKRELGSVSIILKNLESLLSTQQQLKPQF